MKPLPEPTYKKDILDQLLHADGIPAALLKMEEYFGAVIQCCSRACDEIQKLRKENKKLKKELKLTISMSKDNGLERKIIVGEGYPLPTCYDDDKCFAIVLWDEPVDGAKIPLNIPEKLWSRKVKKYRLVLEEI